MTRTRIAAFLIGAVGASVALAGCGSGGGKAADPSTQATPSTITPSASASPVVTASPSAAADDGLVAIHHDGYTIRLPEEPTARPETVPTKVGSIKLTMYMAGDSDGGTFVVAMNSYPRGVVLDLEGAMRGTATNVGGTIVSDESLQFQHHPARRGRITVAKDGRKVTIFNLVVKVGQRLFQVEYIALKDLKTPPPIVDQVLNTVRFD